MQKNYLDYEMKIFNAKEKPTEFINSSLELVKIVIYYTSIQTTGASTMRTIITKTTHIYLPSFIYQMEDQLIHHALVDIVESMLIDSFVKYMI